MTPSSPPREHTPNSANGLLDEAYAPELVFGLVGAVGTDLHYVADAISSELRTVNYAPEKLSLTNFLRQNSHPVLPDSETMPRDDYINAYQDAGDKLRRKTRQGGVLAQMVIEHIIDARRREPIETLENAGVVDESVADKALDSSPDADFPSDLTALFRQPRDRVAYILRSLKHPDEAKTLKQVYGSRCIIVAVHQSRERSLERLTLDISRSRSEEKAESHIRSASRLYEREADPDRDIDAEELARRKRDGDPANLFGQNVRDTYQHADYFLDGSSQELIDQAVARLIRIVFRAPFETPTREEYAMAIAATTSLRSSAMGRQVGATIVDGANGDVLAVGVNEVPKAGGGQYWSGDEPDGRDFSHGDHTDSTIIVRMSMVREIIEHLQDHELIPREEGEISIKDAAAILSKARVSKLVEFGRVVHAEMSAVTDASRRGVAVEGAMMVCTTYPCHACARHIVASGISEVVYVEPYAKSLAENMHSDAIVRDVKFDGDKRVLFRQFRGVAPERYREFFMRTKDERRDDSGTANAYKPGLAVPRGDDISYQFSEWKAVLELKAALGDIPSEDLD